MSSNRARSPTRPDKPATYRKTRDGRSPRRSPVRNPVTNENEIFGVIDDAIEQGATEDAKKRTAAEQSARKAPVPRKMRSKTGGKGRIIDFEEESKIAAGDAQARSSAEAKAKRRANAKQKEADRIRALAREQVAKRTAAKKDAEKKEETDRLKAERERVEAEEAQKKEARMLAQKEAKEKARQAKLEEEAKVKAEKEAKIQAQREAKEAAQRAKLEEQARAKAEKEAKIQAQREAKEAAQRAKLEEQPRAKAEKEAKIQAQREAKEKAQRAKLEEQARAKAEKEAKMQAQKEEAKQEQARKTQKEAKIKAQQAEKEKSKVAKLKKEKKRKAQVKAEETARRKAQREARIKANGGAPPVERVPKRSALMTGKQAEEYRKKKERDALATWQNSGDRWQIVKHTFGGRSTSETKEQTIRNLTLEQAMEEFKKNPEKYVAVIYFPPKPDEFTFILRGGTIRYRPEGLRTDKKGQFRIIQHMYRRLDPFPDNLLPPNGRDQWSDSMSHHGRKLNSETKEDKKAILPGRGMGIGDAATMKFLEDPEPNDVWQGSVGDCWLLSAIACLADFDFAVTRLFRKTKPSIQQRPLDQPNQYTVTLWDVSTWKEVDVVIDERLPVQPDGSGHLLGAKPSKDGKLWVPYLEKAIAVHCGGWDKLEGGKPIDAWSMMTGSRNQYLIAKNPKNGKYTCSAKYNANEQRWSDHTNSPHDSDQSCWRVDWPKVGGGGSRDLELTEDELFRKIVAWDEYNYLIGAGTDGASDTNMTDGIVDNHAYSIIDSREDICGTGIDLLLVRNPWGRGGEIDNGQFIRHGPGWDRYPDILEELDPVMEDNGLFWVTKKEFFTYFPTIYLCEFNMTRLKDKDYVNDLADNFVRKEKKKKPKTAIPDDDEIRVIILNKESDPSSPYKIVEETYDGAVSFGKMNKEVVKGKSIAEGVDIFRANPDKYLGIHFQTSAVAEGWPDEMHVYTFIHRQGTEGLEVDGVTSKGKRTILTHVLR